MRQYRGLTKEGKWVYGWITYGDKPPMARMYGPKGYIAEVIPESVSQFTGLKDKNGTDLNWWEGDIFARASDRKVEGVIIYDLGCFWLDRVRGGRTPLYECVDWSMCRIANIHQNPNLLEQENG